MSKKEPKVAIVHDWLVGYAGGDRVVDAMKRVFPDAVIYTLVYDPKNMPEHFKSYDIRTSWFQKVPFSNRLYKAMLPLMPRAFEAFDLTEYWCCRRPPPVPKASSPARMPYTSATATRRSVMCGIFTTPTAPTPTGWRSSSCPARCTKCASGTSAPRTVWIISSPTRIISPSASKNITGVTAMSFTPAATSTSRLLSKRRTST